MVGLPIREQSTRDKMTGNKQLYINLKITNGKVWQRIPTSILFKKKREGVIYTEMKALVTIKQ